MNMRKVIREAAEKERMELANEGGGYTLWYATGDNLESLYLAAERAGWERAIEAAAQLADIWDNDGTPNHSMGSEISELQYTEPKE